MSRSLRRPRVSSDGHEADRPTRGIREEHEQMSHTTTGKSWQETVQSGQRITVAARLGWGVLVGLSLVLFALSVPARYEELAELAGRASMRLEPGLLRGFLPEDFYAAGVLSLEISFVLALALASAAMVRRNFSDWRPLLFSAAFVSYSVWATPTLDALALPGALQTLANLTQAAGLLMAVLFFLLFPDGRFAPGWARLSALGWTAYCLFWGLFPDSPLSLADPFGASFGAFLILVVSGWALGLVAQAARYRRADPRQRAQTRWVLFAAGGACAGYAVVYLTGALLPASGEARLFYDLFGVPVFWLLALPIPVALAVAMLRHHLFDVEIVVSLALVYGTLTAVLAGVFEVTLVTVQHTLLVLTHVEDSRLAYFLTAMVMAALFEPLKRRIDALVDRLFFRQDEGAGKDEPAQAPARRTAGRSAVLAADREGS